MIHFDTSFVVDFLRETSRDEAGPATTLSAASKASFISSKGLAATAYLLR